MPFKVVILLAASVLFVAGCQSEDAEITEEAATAPTEAVETPVDPTPPRERMPRNEAPAPAAYSPSQSAVDPAREMPRLQGALNEDGFGLSMIVDGSSPQALADSLELIAADTSAEQYQSLESALQYLKTYTLGPNDLAGFYATIDGMTAEEIIERAQRASDRSR